MSMFIATLLKPFVVLIFMVAGVFLVAFLERKLPEGKIKRILLTPIGKRSSSAKH